MIQRQRDSQILDQLEADLNTYKTTGEPAGVIYILNQAHELHLSYDLDTLDELLDLFHHTRGAAIAVYDDLYPLPPEEAQRICRARRLLIKQMGIRA